MTSQEKLLIKEKLEYYNQNKQSLLFANPYSHNIKDTEGNLICCFCQDKHHHAEYEKCIPIYKEVLAKEVNRVRSFFENINNDYESKLKFAFNIKGWEEHSPGNVSLALKYSENLNIIESFEQQYKKLRKEEDNLLKKEFRITNNKYLCPTYLGAINNEISDFSIDLTPENEEERNIVQAWLGYFISNFYHNSYKGSEFDSIHYSKPLPFKYILKDTVLYFYNPDFMGLFNCEFLLNNMGREFNPSVFLNDFKEGFKQGELDLENEYEIKLTDFYDSNKNENLIQVLKYILYEKEFDNERFKGLIHRINNLPLNWNHDIINKYGFYNGLFHSIAELQKKIGFDLVNNSNKKQDNPEENINDQRINPYPQIFKDVESFEFFENLLQDFEIKTSRSQVSDLTDIYILMQKDDLIFESFKPTPFVNWLNEKYDFLSIDRLETVSTRRTPKRKYAIYNKAKQLFYKTSA